MEDGSIAPPVMSQTYSMTQHVSPGITDCFEAT